MQLKGLVIYILSMEIWEGIDLSSLQEIARWNTMESQFLQH
jgi:hypothetical protein